jgi:hypothetical protein
MAHCILAAFCQCHQYLTVNGRVLPTPSITVTAVRFLPFNAFDIMVSGGHWDLLEQITCRTRLEQHPDQDEGDYQSLPR